MEDKAEQKLARFKELEEKIKKLENENKQLLYKVNTSSPPHSRKLHKNQLHNGHSRTLSLDEDELENGVLDVNTLLNENGKLKEDEWLFVSPKFPPTPVQKKISPHEWLSEGHNRQGKSTDDIPTLDDVRKNLMCSIDEAENLSDMMASYNSATSPTRKLMPSSNTNQRNQGKERLHSLSPPLEGTRKALFNGGEALPVADTSSAEESAKEKGPQKKWKVKQVPAVAPQEGFPVPVPLDSDVPVVKWKAKMPEDNQASDVPVVKWKAKMPEDNLTSDVPVVKWKAKVPEDNQASDVPVVKWKAKMPEDNPTSDVPVVKWKAKMPEDNLISDVPVVKWKAKVPEDNRASDVPVVKKAKMPEDSDVPVVKWKAKVPEDNQTSDVPVVKWKAKVPEDNLTSDVPVVKWKAKVPEDNLTSDVPVVKKKAKMPEDSDVPVVKWKAKVPEDNQASDVPIVKWKAKVPQDNQTSDVPIVKRKAKVPGSSPRDAQVSDVPVVKWKAKPSGVKQKTGVPPESQSDVPVVKWKAKLPEGSDAQTDPEARRHRSPKPMKGLRKIAKIPDDEMNNSSSAESLHRADESIRPSRITSYQAANATSRETSSPVRSPSHSPHRRGSSRRSSISDSRSPSPPSIAPQVRMAIASPILSRRTPSPSRGSLAGSMGSLARQSPSASPILQHKQLQHLSGSQQQSSSQSSQQHHLPQLPGNRPSSGMVSPGSKLRTPRSQVKASSPLRGLTPPGERKQKRVLPPSPDPALMKAGGDRSKQHRPTKGPQRAVPQASPGPDVGDDDDSWLEGCF